MKFNFKKISAVATSVLMMGMTMGVAAAANYPAPFVEGNTANVAIVYGTGTGVSTLDMTQSTSIQEDLSKRFGTKNTNSFNKDGSFRILKSGSDFLYLNDPLGNNVQTLTKDDLSKVLSDGVFTDDSGTDYKYEQMISISTNNVNSLEFGDSDNDFDDPKIMLDLSDSESTPIYTWKVVFNDPINFTNADTQSEEINLFGKDYTIGTKTDSNQLVLLGGADSTRVNVGDTKTLNINDKSYDITLNGLSQQGEASITVNGDTGTFSKGKTKKMDEIDVFVRTIFKTGDNAGYVEIELGSDRLVFENGNQVKVGEQEKDISGTEVIINPNLEAISTLEVKIATEDNDKNHVLLGESFVDPVFKSLVLTLDEVYNAPEFDGEQDVSEDREKLAIVKGGDRELLISLDDSSGNEKTIPFGYNGDLSDEDGNIIHLVEGKPIAKDEYFILNSGNNQHFMKMTKISINSGYGNDDDVVFEDLFTGSDYRVEDKELGFAGNRTLKIISSQDYYVEAVNTSSVRVYRKDAYNITSGTGSVNVFPYIELLSGKDHRVAFFDDVTLDNVSTGTLINLPTEVVKVTGAGTFATEGTAGSVKYNINATVDGALTDLAISVAENQVDGTGSMTNPGVLFIEEEDNTETTADTKNAIIITTSDDGVNMEANKTIFAGHDSSIGYDEESWDDNDYKGYLTNFGTYVLEDYSDSNQKVIEITYPSEQMYADVYMAEAEGITTEVISNLGNVIVKDSEVSSVSSKNLIVVGGSCINSAAATLIGGNYCGAKFTEATGVGSGQFLIKGYSSSSITSKLALLVAGYEAADTVNAATYLRTKTVDTDKAYKGNSSTSAELIAE
jgi:hypothetical protein